MNNVLTLYWADDINQTLSFSSSSSTASVIIGDYCGNNTFVALSVLPLLSSNLFPLPDSLSQSFSLPRFQIIGLYFSSFESYHSFLQKFDTHIQFFDLSSIFVISVHHLPTNPQLCPQKSSHSSLTVFKPHGSLNFSKQHHQIVYFSSKSNPGSFYRLKSEQSHTCPTFQKTLNLINATSSITRFLRPLFQAFQKNTINDINWAQPSELLWENLFQLKEYQSFRSFTVKHNKPPPHQPFFLSFLISLSTFLFFLFLFEMKIFGFFHFSNALHSRFLQIRSLFLKTSSRGGLKFSFFLDTIVGFLIAFLIFYKSPELLLSTLRSFLQILYGIVIQGVMWLTQWPAGFKLNDSLSYILANSITYILSEWNAFLSATNLFSFSSSNSILCFICFCSSFCGFSCFLACLSDLLYLICLNIEFMYKCLHLFVQLWSSIISYYFLVLRGKKQNVERSRLDNHSYETEQLVVGTILFTILLFLFPTLFAFYFFIFFVRSLLKILSCLFFVCEMFVFLFPFWDFLLRLFNSSHLSNGVVFNRIYASNCIKIPPQLIDSDYIGDTFRLQSNPRPLSSFFKTFFFELISLESTKTVFNFFT
jgi:hypothetical protein